MNITQIKLLLCAVLVASLLIFAFEWLRGRRQLRLGRLILASVGLSVTLVAFGAIFLTGLFFYMMSDSVTARFDPPLMVEQARRAHCPIPLPDSARNVQFLSIAGGMQAREILVRFEAPLRDCRNEVQTVMEPDEKLRDPSYSWQHLRPILRTPTSEDHDMAGRATWFDINHIQHGVTTDDGQNTQIWIDEGRSLFYCRITD